MSSASASTRVERRERGSSAAKPASLTSTASPAQLLHADRGEVLLRDRGEVHTDREEVHGHRSFQPTAQDACHIP